MLRLTVTVAALVLTAPGCLRAQLAPGAHVRIAPMSPSRPRVEGTLVTSSRDSLILAMDPAPDTVAVPVGPTDRVEIRVARSRPALVLEGAGAGLLVGAAGGALVGPVFTSACVSATTDISAEGPCTTHLVFDTRARVRGAIGFGLGGAVLGAVIGGIAGRARWRRVSVRVGGSAGRGLSGGWVLRF
jgi:hypothetical protein